MFFNNRRVDEDIERIRKANLKSAEHPAEQMTDAKEEESVRNNDLRITFKDIVAIIIAVFSLVLPYLAVLTAAITLLLLWFFR